MNKKISSASHLRGLLHLPADKSISHRAALFAALHEGQSIIQNFSTAADPHATLRCLRQLGVKIEEHDNQLTIEGVGRDGFKLPEEPLDCGNSGTTMRLLSGIVGGAGLECILTGDASLRARTMRRIIQPLGEMGINIEAREDDFAPLHFPGNKGVTSIHFPLPIPSAQLKSSVLLAGLFGDSETTVIETKISRDHTERLLQLPVEHQDGEKIIRSSRACEIPSQRYRVPGDFSAASFWLAAGSIHPSADIRLPGVGMNPTRTGSLTLLQKMGARISIKNERKQGREPVADLCVSSSTLQPIDITADLVPNCIDEIPILLVAMCFADGVSTIRGAGELRHKETDRLKAMANLLEVAGAKYEAFEDGFTIYGDPHFTPTAASFDSENDHRIAMSAAVLAMMAAHQSTIQDASCTAISYPSFWNDVALLTN